MRNLDRLLAPIKYILSPPRCAECRLLLPVDTVFCVICGEKIIPIVSVRLSVTTAYSVPVFALSAYQGPFKSLILAKKRSCIAASRQLGELMRDQLVIRQASADYIIPIPLHWTRFAYRGYNQAYEIALVISRGLGKPVMHALKREKRTSFQSTLTSEQRAENVAQAFSLKGDSLLYKDKHLMLVDDLMTTGATVKEAVRVLMKAKPASISVVVACRVT